MRVLVLTESYPTSEHPGRGIFIQEQAAALASHHEVSVLFPQPSLPGVPSKWLERQAKSLDADAVCAIPTGIHLLRPEYFYVPRHRGVRGRQLTYILRNTLRQTFPRPFDVVHAHWLAPAGFAAVRAVTGMDIPVVVTAHAGDVYRDLKQPRHRHVAREVAKRASRIIAVAEYFRGPLAEIGATEAKVRVIPNGVDLAVFTPLERDRARTELQLPQGVPIYLYIGNLELAKGAADVVEAFFAHAPAEAVLVVAGTGPLWKQFEQRVKQFPGRMLLRGWQAHKRVAWYLAAADFFVLASYAEGNPVTVLESLCCGTPVIGSTIPAIAPLIMSGVNGLLVEAGRVEALGKAMNIALSVQWDRAAIVRAAAARYGWVNVAERIAAVYAEAAERSRSSACT